MRKPEKTRLNANRHLLALCLTTLALSAIFPSFLIPPGAAAHPGTVTVVITRVQNIGDEGIEDDLRGQADLYAGVTISGQGFDSFNVHVDDADDVQPFWTFAAVLPAATPDSVSVSIQIWDHDDCDSPFCSDDDVGLLESGDDKGDADPAEGDKDVDLTVDRTTGAWSGDTTGGCSEGTGDDAVLVCWSISVDSVASWTPVTVTIWRVRNIGDEGIEDNARGEADMYAGVTILGARINSFRGHPHDQDDISPFWVFTNRVSSSGPTLIPVSIEIWDHDDCDDPTDNDEDSPFCGGDDKGDVDPTGGAGERNVDLTVDTTTGTWTGDTTGNCSQGDADGGGDPENDIRVLVCWDISTVSTSGDADSDALLDGWELLGYDRDGDGTIDVSLPSMGANPLRQDMYLEIDCLVSDGNNNGVLTDPVDHTHCPIQLAVSDVVTAFANAPTSNPDGTTGVQLHIDTGPLYGVGIVTSIAGTGGSTGTYGDMGGGGSQIPEAGNLVVDWDGSGGATSFYSLKGAPGNFFNSLRDQVFRYALFIHQTNARSSANDCTSGWAEDVRANDFLVSLGGQGDLNGDSVGDFPCWTSGAANTIDEDGDGAVDEDPSDGIDNDGDCLGDTDGDGNLCDFFDQGVDEDGGFSVGSRAEQAGTLMHEMGHTIGLDHSGGASLPNFEPNYLSVMNYALQTCGVPTGPVPATLPGGCDYSRDDLNDLVETNLDECAGLDSGFYGLGPTDWDGDGVFEGATCTPSTSNVLFDINNNDGILGTLTGFDDWDALFFPFRDLGNFADGVSNPVPDEPDRETFEQARLFLSNLLQPDLAMDKSAPSDAIPGDTLTYTLRVTNEGKGPAFDVALTDTLPDGSSTLFNLGVIQATSETTREIFFDVPCDTADLTILSNSVTVTGTDIVGLPEANTADNFDTASTVIHAPVLVLSKTATSSVNAGEAITFTITYENIGSGEATQVVVTDTLPVDVYYSMALDQGAGPLPDLVTTNGTITLTWTIGILAAFSGPRTIEYTARPSLLFLGGELLSNSAQISFQNPNGCVYPSVSTSETTEITTVAPTQNPEGIGFWRTHPTLWTDEVLARIQATDDRFDGADGSIPDGMLSPGEVQAVFVPGGNMGKILEEELLAAYFNLATRRINAATMIESRTADRYGLNNVRDAALFAQNTLELPVNSLTRTLYSDATRVLDDINTNRIEVY